jgi:hypothetical protein
MTLQQIDDALDAWNKRLAAIAENLMELQAEPTYQMLSGAGGRTRAHLTGRTQAIAEPAIQAIGVVFGQFGLLHHVIDQAAKLRKTLPTLFGAEQKQRELAQLLFGRSIELSSIAIPLDQRGLLSGAQRSDWISPDELLIPMTKNFAAARDAILSVDRAWQELSPEIERAEAELARILARAPRPADGSDSPAISGVYQAERLLAELRNQQKEDPLGAFDALRAQVQPAIARASRQVEAVRQLDYDLRSAHERMRQLVKLREEAVSAQALARAKVVGCTSLPEPCPAATLTQLSAWLDRLDARRNEGLFEPVAVGLRNWHAAAEACSQSESKVLSLHQAAVNTRNELRGRLDALKAKARVYGVAERDQFAELAQHAETLLFQGPTDLELAAAAVAVYEKTLSQARQNEEVTRP